MPPAPRLTWLPGQKEALDKAKEEFHAFLDKIDYQCREKRKQPCGKEGQSVINVHDELVVRMMQMRDTSGNNVFPLELTQV
jgi:hypothetical protein